MRLAPVDMAGVRLVKMTAEQPAPDATSDRTKNATAKRIAKKRTADPARYCTNCAIPPTASVAMIVAMAIVSSVTIAVVTLSRRSGRHRNR